jgi:hypothetical protein
VEDDRVRPLNINLQWPRIHGPLGGEESDTLEGQGYDTQIMSNTPTTTAVRMVLSSFTA